MKGVFLFFLCILTLFLSFGECRENKQQKKTVYIVYTGAKSTSKLGSSRQTHIELLASVLQRREHAEKRLLRVYSRSFSGCAVRLTEEEAHQIRQRSDIISVFPDPIYKLHTTRSWDFLQYDIEKESIPKLKLNTQSDGTDTFIGLLDTGVWPEAESFKDTNMGPIPPRWKGTCMDGNGFKDSICNRKIIGARYYNNTASDEDGSDRELRLNDEDQTARDTVGHGTHTASTAAGSPVPGASYYGLANGTAKGGSPGSRIAVYKVCDASGCHGSAILAAFDDAISDGVDILSLSLGAASYMRPDFATDPIAIGSFHAVEKGITVVCSGGNDGPSAKTVVNIAPWILTVAATTIDRDFESDVVLGGNKVLKGEGIHFSSLKETPVHPIIYGISAKSTTGTADDASNCYPSALAGEKIKGKIVVCDHSGNSYSKKEIMEAVKEFGGIGLILIDDLEKAVAAPSGDFPVTIVSSKQSADILSYINSTINPTATILPTVTVTNYKPAPTVPYFSSRGPSYQTKNLLKPDIAAPGVNILAAWMETNHTDNVPSGRKPSSFNLLSGTSMACPHVTGIAAAVKSVNPTWTPSMIKSAIMTTAVQTDSSKTPLTDNSGSAGTPYDYGAGEVSPAASLQPGLVYEATTNDYLVFLCNYGLDVPTIKLIIRRAPGPGFECSKNSSKHLISDLNYPSIAVSNISSSRTVSRTVTNVGDEEETTYTVSVNSPQGVEVKVVPEKLQFTKASKKLSYQVTFSADSSTNIDLFGSLVWTDGKYRVQTPFVVSS